jgi:hypothetical protein
VRAARPEISLSVLVSPPAATTTSGSQFGDGGDDPGMAHHDAYVDVVDDGVDGVRYQRSAGDLGHELVGAEAGAGSTPDDHHRA